MTKTELECAVETLVANYRNEDFRLIHFWRYLELCCEDAEFYILKDLRMLAEVIQEQQAEVLIEPIKLYNYVAGERVQELLS